MKSYPLAELGCSGQPWGAMTPGPRSGYGSRALMKLLLSASGGRFKPGPPGVLQLTEGRGASRLASSLSSIHSIPHLSDRTPSSRA